jgi:hypothetical protein
LPSLQRMLGNFRSFLRFRGIETLTPMFFNDEELLAGYAGEFVIPLDRARWTFSRSFWHGRRVALSAVCL